ncbi:MAG: hypothetical protein COV75_05085 [Candidatus Omnitrophica bacterium CG11_big_fil_rev_8_21_14_0_20_63_9]|nr:MAG: hypothetical protein COV75_05085 [Candidatus Omnitrophica bacterium CG11_big_fil_rev_8_21_14_0_20_63_9]
MTLERLGERLKQLQLQRIQAVATVHAVDGAIQEIERWIEEMEKEQGPKEVDDGEAGPVQV